MENSENSPTSGSIAPELINPNPVPEIVMPSGNQPAEAHRSIRYRLTHLFSRGEKLKPHELQKQRDDLKNAASQGTETQNSTPSPVPETAPSQTSGTTVETTAPLPQGLQEIGTTQEGSASNVDSMIQELAEKEHTAAAAQDAPPPAPQQKDPISSDTSGAMDAMTARMAQMPDTASSAAQPGENSNTAAARPDLPPVESSSTPPPVEAQPNQNAQIIDFQTAAARVQESKAVQPGAISSETPPMAPPVQTSEVSQNPQPLVKAA